MGWNWFPGAKKSSELVLTLRKKGDQIERRFADFKGTDFGDTLAQLAYNPVLLEALKRYQLDSVAKKILEDSNFGLLTNWQAVPWYLDIIGSRILESNEPCVLHVKACKGYQFVEITDDKKKPLLAPFFHKTSKPNERAVADLLLLLAHKLVGLTEKAIYELWDWHDISLTFKRLNSGVSERSFRLSLEVFWYKGKFKNHSLKLGDKETLISSEKFRAAMAELALAWHDPLARTVLISARPGSGKEFLKGLFGYARNWNGSALVEFSAPNLAALQDSSKGICDELRKNKLIHKDAVRPTVLFLDEIHQDTAQPVRDQLLRVLTNNALIMGNSKVSCDEVTYLFAASKSQKEVWEGAS